jgi:hypothetical protein
MLGLQIVQAWAIGAEAIGRIGAVANPAARVSATMSLCQRSFALWRQVR